MSSVTDQAANSGSDRGLVRIAGSVGGIKYDAMSTKEIVIGESLLNPSVMVSVTFQSLVYGPFTKNFMDLKDKSLNFQLFDGLNNFMNVGGDGKLKVFRLDNRHMMPANIGKTEEFSIHACHETVLTDAKKLMSKSWKCTTPDQVVRDALKCIESSGNDDIGGAEPARDYIAENIHPFQVIQQQCNVALDQGDPSFVHYMTFNTQSGAGIHHFKSLKSMISGANKALFKFVVNEEHKLNYNDPKRREKVISFEFPCMFDYLTDLLNGVDQNGMNFNAVTTWNPVSMEAFFKAAGGGQQNPCIDAANMKQSITNKGSSQQDYGCETDVESHLLLRQARMALLDRDKIAFRFTTYWRPDLHAGDKINFLWIDTDGSSMPESQQYVITSLTHKIQLGGFATSTFDCIKTTFV